MYEIRFTTASSVVEKTNLFGIAALGFLNPGGPMGLAGIPLRGVTSDIFLGMVLLRTGNPPETLDFILLAAS